MLCPLFCRYCCCFMKKQVKTRFHYLIYFKEKPSQTLTQKFSLTQMGYPSNFIQHKKLRERGKWMKVFFKKEKTSLVLRFLIFDVSFSLKFQIMLFSYKGPTLTLSLSFSFSVLERWLQERFCSRITTGRFPKSSWSFHFKETKNQ